MIDGRLALATQAFLYAQEQLATQILRRVRELTQDAYPDAIELQAGGRYVADGVIHLHVRCVVSPGGRVRELSELAATGFVDEVNPLLDWLAQISGDDYLGEQTLGLI